MSSRSLSYDEQKAAEAAFHDRPFNPSWSKAARTVYDGILQAKSNPTQKPVATATLSIAESDTQITERPAIDITDLAKSLGASFPVLCDQDLWHELSGHQDETVRLSRARDIVIALLVARSIQGNDLLQTIEFPAILWDSMNIPHMHRLVSRYQNDPFYHGSLLIRRPVYMPHAND